jgi:hypothetical protein
MRAILGAGQEGGLPMDETTDVLPAARMLKGAVAPVLLLALAGYFLASALYGDRGLVADRERRLQEALAELKRAQQDEVAIRQELGARKRLDPDLIDELVRKHFGKSRRDEIVVPMR